jgi:hypothetical protein
LETGKKEKEMQNKTYHVKVKYTNGWIATGRDIVAPDYDSAWKRACQIHASNDIVQIALKEYTDEDSGGRAGRNQCLEP